MKELKNDACFTPLNSISDEISLPQKFTFPFYYEAHPLAILASNDLKKHLQEQTEWQHNFGLDPKQSGLIIGKMFGVLVVKNSAGKLGYLAAFSGKLANENHWSKFVPPVFDLLEDNGFFKLEEIQLNELNRKIENLIESNHLISLKNDLKIQLQNAAVELESLKKQHKENKAIRDAKRNTLISTKEEIELKNESISDSYQLKKLQKKWQFIINNSKENLAIEEKKLNDLKEERRNKSNQLQKKIFEQYQFLNINKETKSLNSIFSDTVSNIPPAGAGECCAPKLLNYAFANNLIPICMAEFWWGASPASEVRQHKQFYPACKGKCEPILKHMLEGIELDDNPMLAEQKNTIIPILYEDDELLVINKPAELLSVPGKTIYNSVYSYFKEKLTDASGPIIVHRLDQSTSGIMVLAKTLETYKHLQQQFIKRKVKKRYQAVLSSEIDINKGIIELPLRVDLDDRPRQMVCYEHGKSALTTFEVLKVKNGKSLVYFYPHTGRTHQLRVHSAHISGLNAAIVGDDLYGKKSDRLYLHADRIEFMHPKTKEIITIECDSNFIHSFE